MFSETFFTNFWCSKRPKMSKMAYTILRLTQRHWRKSRQRKRHCNLPMNPVNTATYLGVHQAATAGGVLPTTKPGTAADTDTGHSTHHGTLRPGPGILPTSRAQRSYRIPGLAPNAPPTHAASGRYHSATSVDHPRPPAHIATCNGTRGITTVLRGQHRSPRQQRVHSSHCGPPASSHAQS